MEGIEPKLKRNAYEVFLNEKGQLRWRGYDGDQELIFQKEPDTSWWDRFVAGFFRIMPIRSQL